MGRGTPGHRLARAWRVLRRWLLWPVRRESPAQRLGREGEAAAVRHLRGEGFSILGRNVVTDAGEADIVAQDPDGRTAVVVEVKTRARGVSARADAIAPEAAVTPAKKRRLRAVMHLLARANGWHERPKRIDVVAVEVLPGGAATIRHTRGVA